MKYRLSGSAKADVLHAVHRIRAEMRIPTDRLETALRFMVLRRVGTLVSSVGLLLVAACAVVLLVDGRSLSSTPVANVWPAIYQTLSDLMIHRTAGFWVGTIGLPFVAVVPAYLISNAFTKSVVISTVFKKVVGSGIRLVSNVDVRLMDAIDLRGMMHPPAPIWVTTRTWVIDPPERRCSSTWR